MDSITKDIDKILEDLKNGHKIQALNKAEII